jgi:beta-N-acetylhexosaminidase
MVMTAHVLFPAIDPVEPATFSRTLIAELLRGELGYEGIIVSDDLEMRAISRRIEQDGAIAEPFSAGCDMAIVARYVRESSGFFESISASRKRIDTLLRATPMPTVEQLSKEILEDHARLAIEVTL